MNANAKGGGHGGGGHGSGGHSSGGKSSARSNAPSEASTPSKPMPTNTSGGAHSSSNDCNKDKSCGKGK